MGSAQTNSLVESLARHGCRAIIKVGTCSALDSRLREGDVIVPSGALIDEGATSWRRVKNQNDLGFFNTEVSVDRYIRNLEVVCANEELRKKMVQKCRKRKIRYRNRLSDQYVWSVDAYDCFDSSVRLYSKVNKKQYILREFLSGSIFSVLLLGVEMECSSLFSSAQAMGISAAAMVVVSRTLARLIASNTSPQEQIYYNIHAHLPERDTSDIQKSELKCIETSLEVLENW
jgi:uridine phosphorylase